jgi:hypothetical protein
MMGSPATNDDQIVWFLTALGPEFSAPVINRVPVSNYNDVVGQAKNHEISDRQSPNYDGDGETRS